MPHWGIAMSIPLHAGPLRSRWILCFLAAVAVVVPAAVAAAPATAAPSASRSTIAWVPCEQVFFCTSVTVPLDYDHPAGRQISLALIKQPATDPAHRIGSLFVNPGGPGGSGVDFVHDAGPALFTPEVRARFDIVGFDPRGIIRSTPLQCFDTEAQALAVVSPFPYPNTPRRTQVWIANEHKLDAACAARHAAIMNHMATADAARDLDRLRQAVGDRALTYYGASYGSFLGNTYANLFPNKVRALVIDGVLDPVAWTTGRGDEGREVPFSTRLHSAVGAQATLKEFFRLCDAAGPNCAFAPHAARRYAQLYRALKDDPVSIANPDGTTFQYDESFLIVDTLVTMYDSSSWPDFASFLADLETRADASELAARLSVLRQRTQAVDYFNFLEGFPGVACSDSINPTSYSAWARAARASAGSDGLFGPIWTWVSSICADWPGHDSDRYLGPFTHRTSRPVLVVGNLFDPATPYRGAVTAARLLPNSALLTVHGWGHTSLFLSACADQAIGRYLLKSQTPPRGTVCEQDVVPFTQPTKVSKAASSPAAATAVPNPGWSFYAGMSK
jgi:pimeloyl-ACP methyl ester carboxylesterase